MHDNPPATSPRETSASAARCRKALFTFRSFSLSLKNIKAETPLITIPMAETIAMVNPGKGCGLLKREMASYPIAPMEISNTMALKSEIRIEDFL